MPFVLAIDVDPRAYEIECDEIETFGGYGVEVADESCPSLRRRADSVTLYGRFDHRDSAAEAAAYFAERVDGSNPTITEEP